MIKIIFKIDNEETEVEAIEGDSILETAEKNGIKIFGACGGAGVCGSCHVLIDQEYLSKLEPAGLNEEDLLEVLPNSQSNSRLACQVKVTNAMNGMRVTVP